jgi:hypothetical protein
VLIFDIGQRKEDRMRTILFGAAAFAMLAGSVPIATADNAPYCSTGFGGAVQPTRCDFHT